MCVCRFSGALKGVWSLVLVEPSFKDKCSERGDCVRRAGNGMYVMSVTKGTLFLCLSL